MYFDVLIIGAGPAGLMMAAWLARCGVNVRIIDKRGTEILSGHADGLQSRTLEILDSFGIGQRVWQESNHLIEMCLWNPDSQGVIRRSDRVPDTTPGISRFQQVVLHQGRIERLLLDFLAGSGDIQVERAVMPEATPPRSGIGAHWKAVEDGVYRNTPVPGHPAEHSDETDPGEVVFAKYVIGTDGAHSWTRQQIGCHLEGDSTDYIWGVMDIVPITDFPDIRMSCAIHSANAGSVMIIPRENKLVRLYVQLCTTDKDGELAALDKSSIDPAFILASAKRIMAPYGMAYSQLDWWSTYQIGQRVGNSFSLHQRVFLAGDAVHTHSPKVGQGMNVSMQDAYNLGWKVAGVVQGKLHQSVLQTYDLERRQVALDLIAFDHKLSRLYSQKPGRNCLDTNGNTVHEFKTFLQEGRIFASGTSKIPLQALWSTG